MNDDELLDRLRRADPIGSGRDGSVVPTDDPRAVRLMEQIMNTPESESIHTTAPALAPAPWRRRWALLAAGGAAAVAIVGGVVAFSGDDENDRVAGPPASFSVAAPDLMAMCIAVTEYVPDPGLGGFRGTVVEVGADTVTLDVSQWYAGGDAAQVVLDVSQVGSPALDGVEFQQGGEYLVAVLDGAVQTCGLSGPVDPALEAEYAEWFAG